jgi:hypothetical protein
MCGTPKEERVLLMALVIVSATEKGQRVGRQSFAGKGGAGGLSSASDIEVT